MHHHIIACARSYLGTRFHHQGRLKKTARHKGGIDCLGLLIGIAGELDLRGRNGEPLCELDRIDYSHQPDTNALRKKLEESLYSLPLEGEGWGGGDRYQNDAQEIAPHLTSPLKGGGIRPADILLLSIDGRPQHLALVTDSGIIHAYAPARAVVEHALDGDWLKKIEAAFRLPLNVTPA